MKPEKIYTHEEMLDKVLGKPGDLAREQYETDINAFLIGETIKKARLQRKLTQAQWVWLQPSRQKALARCRFGSVCRFITSKQLTTSCRFGRIMRPSGAKLDL